MAGRIGANVTGDSVIGASLTGRIVRVTVGLLVVMTGSRVGTRVGGRTGLADGAIVGGRTGAVVGASVNKIGAFVG